MKSIKFRAWDKERKEMLPVKLMDFSQWWVSCDPNYQHNTLEYGERNSFKNEETDRHILMQYTGLTDRNGKEIYESDILKVRLVHDEYDTFTVIWSQEKARFELADERGDNWGFTVSNEFEIIGNIYEVS